MKKIFFIQISHYLLLLLVVCSFAASNVELTDIEEALLKQDYESVKNLSIHLLHNSPEDPNKIKINYYLGLSYARLAQYEKAIEILQPLAELKTEPVLRDKIHLSLFDAHYLLDHHEHYESAEKILKTLLKKRPVPQYSSLIYLKYARVNLKLAKWNEAKKYLEKILEHFPKSIEFPYAQQLLDEKQFFTVQVGAYLQQDKAQEIVEKLTAQQEYAYIVQTQGDGEKTFYRVRVGQLSKLEQAQELRTKLAGLGYPAQIYP
jgi:tetratricopeptide (TPR) repeat protein